MKPHVDLLVWGDFACFTRPEFKAERESYPCITPSAARGLLEAIYWKPQMRYRILEIHIHQKGSRFSLLRNELESRQTDRGTGVFVDDIRQQRNSLILRNVAYRIIAWIDIRADEPGENIGKHLSCYERRASVGAYHHKPVLGCREFPANFAHYGSENIDPNLPNAPESINESFGTMLFDTAFVPKGDEMTFYRHVNRKKGIVQGSARRFFFEAKAENGIIKVPQERYNEIAKLEGKQWVSTKH